MKTNNNKNINNYSNDKSIPLVSIAIPVYNEGRFIKDTLDSILSQGYKNIEILIGDNCSTDETNIICKHYAEIDDRIVYFQHKKNIGIGMNHSFLHERAKGKYFMWAAGHDMWSNNFISEAIALFENNKSLLLVYGTPVWIRADGTKDNKCNGWYDTRGLNPVARFLMVFWGGMNPLLGLYRLNVIPNMRMFNYVGSDLILLGQLALRGEFAHAVKSTFYRRQNRLEEDWESRMNRYKSKKLQMCDSILTKTFPLAKIPFELFKLIAKAKINFIEKLYLSLLLIPSIPTRYLLGRKERKYR